MVVPPKTPSDWLKSAKGYGVESTTIHDLEDFKSGSKIEEAQYLALRVLWRQADSFGFDPEEWDLDRDLAKKHLDSQRNWSDYIQNLHSGQKCNPQLGTFDMLWHYQQTVTALAETGPQLEKVYSPISSRTRRGLQLKTSQPEATPSKVQDKIQETGSTPVSFTPSRTPQAFMNRLIRGMAEMDTSEYEPPSPTPTRTPYSVASRGDSGEHNQFPPVDDEQIVNTALILLLQGVCLRAQGVEKAQWTQQRKSFNFKKKIRGQQGKTIKLFQSKREPTATCVSI
ncbi:hypothetical protein EMCG_02411 [[Emmonsia] crescens]|uniref:Uncharacterized protein n=1 Tax=[Emmonsia] crescens TaxID=73230 RepID=A0A0G2J918_9EURO|nr:hypothetical protein EMCG_02411 [Emmonsia crescens UAMH 3008]